MADLIIHIAEFVGKKRVKVCDGTALSEIPSSNKGTRVLCEKCRIEFRSRNQ